MNDIKIWNSPVWPDSIRQLYECKGKIQEQEEKEIPGSHIWIDDPIKQKYKNDNPDEI